MYAIVVVVPWLLNGLAVVPSKVTEVLLRTKPKDGTSHTSKKPWYSCLVSATLIVRLLLMMGYTVA